MNVHYHVGFVVLTAMTMEATIFWYGMPRSSVGIIGVSEKHSTSILSLKKQTKEVASMSRWQAELHICLSEMFLPCPQYSATLPQPEHPVHILTQYFSNASFNIALPPMLRSPKWSLPFRFSDNNSVCFPHPLSPTWISIAECC
jgi:hypothetical protein